MIRYLLPSLCLLSSTGLFSQEKRVLAPVYKDLLLEPGKTMETGLTKSYRPGTDAYLVRAGGLPPGSRLLRRLDDTLQVVEIRSAAEWRDWSAKTSLLLPLNGNWKLSPDLLATISGWEISDQPVDLVIRVTDISSFQAGAAGIPRLKIRGIDIPSGTLALTAPGTWIKKALRDPGIRFIGLLRKPATERELTGFDLSANQVNAAHRNWPAVNGKGLVISIKENRMDTADIDFRGRYRFSPNASPLMETHATTMATIAAGGGNSFYTGKGVAWGSGIISSDFATLLPDPDNILGSQQVSVQNHSYGTGIENYYGADAAAYDQQANRRPELLHVFSAGNAGNQSSASGPYAGITGFANLTGSFKMAKNLLLVGAMDSLGNVPLLSSRGPAFDGRVKPELVAFGEDGSSGAAAIVSGIALLVQDLYHKKTGKLPPSALTRALLVNAADDLGPEGPDYISGFGRANAYRALQQLGQNQVDSGSLQNGGKARHLLSIPANATRLKVTLCWNDPAGTANSRPALVNDLDLELAHAGSSQGWKPWVLNSYPHPDSLSQTPSRNRDSLNNIEQVSILNPPPGDYYINVQAYALVSASQPYYLSWSYDTLDAFRFSFPVSSDQLYPGRSNTIRWESTISGTASLDYSTDGGQNWLAAGSGIDLAKGYHKWQAPDVFSPVILRMNTTKGPYFSDTAGISRNLAIKTGFNCPDSFLVYWNKEQAASQYRVYRLGSQYLEAFATLTDTALIQTTKDNPYEYFSVAPVLGNGAEGMKAFTFNYRNQGVACYISNFLADPNGNSNASLTLSLGTTYNVKSIGFEKWNGTGFTSIYQAEPVADLLQRFIAPANNGLNIYRAKIELENGLVLYSKAEQVFIFNDQDYYIFPNPIPRGGLLRILARDLDNTVFQLFDAMGRMVLKQPVVNTFQEINTAGLASGIYFFHLYKNGVKERTGKILVQ